MSSAHFARQEDLPVAASSGGRDGFHSSLPTTRFGKWAAWLALAFVILFSLNSVFVGMFGMRSDAAVVSDIARVVGPIYGIGMLLVGLVAGALGVFSIIRQKERSLFALLAVLPALFVLFLLVGEFLFPH